MTAALKRRPKMKIKNLIRFACLGGVLYAVYSIANAENKDYTELDLFEEPNLVAEEKTDFREKLEADLKEAEARYQD